MDTEELNISEIEIERQQEFQTEAVPHKDALYNYALKIVRNSDDAQDLVQDTYYKAYKNIINFRVVQTAKHGCL